MSAWSCLLVEDDAVDVAMVQRAFREEKIRGPLYVASGAVEALAELRSDESLMGRRRPDVVLLDLDMPKMNGLEFLRQVRQDARLRSLIVFVLTGSNSDEDRKACYELNVAGIIRKTHLEEGLRRAIQGLNAYLTTIELP